MAFLAPPPWPLLLQPVELIASAFGRQSILAISMT